MYHVRFVWQAYGQFRYVQIDSVAWNAQQKRLGTRDPQPTVRVSLGGKRAGLPPAVGLEMVEQYLSWSYFLNLLAFCLIYMSWCIVKVKGFGGLGVVKLAAVGPIKGRWKPDFSVQFQTSTPLLRQFQPILDSFGRGEISVAWLLSGWNVTLPYMSFLQKSLGFLHPKHQHCSLIGASGMPRSQDLYDATEWSTRWVWPFELYAPVFEAAKANGSPLVALNPATEVEMIFIVCFGCCVLVGCLFMKTVSSSLSQVLKDFIK